MLAEMLAVIGAIASMATAIGVGIAGYQLRMTKELAAAQFEDQLTKQYRELIRGIPVRALLGERLDDHEIEENLAAFYHYFDLSNEQAFLHEKGRIRAETWEEWSAGIRQNFERRAFRDAWAKIAPAADGSFGELRRLLEPGSVARQVEIAQGSPAVAS